MFCSHLELLDLLAVFLSLLVYGLLQMQLDVLGRGDLFLQSLQLQLALAPLLAHSC